MSAKHFRLAIGAVLLTLAGCASVPEVCDCCSDPWQPSGLNSHFVKPQQPGYDGYAAAKRQLLQQAKYFPEWLDAREREQRIARITPQRHVPEAGACSRLKTRAVILVHGLFDTPFIMGDLRRFLNSQCYVTYDVLLTGHGTRPGDLLAVSRDDWQREIAYVVKQVEQEHRELYIGGFSLGGALSLYAARRFDAIKGVLLFAPALRPTNKAAYAAVPVGVLPESYFKRFAEYDYAKYESLPARAGGQTYLLGAEVAKYLKQGFDKPLFVAVSLEDATIDAAYTVDTTRARAANRMLVFAADLPKARRLCRDYDARNGGESCRVIASARAQQGVRSLSHVGLVVSPQNDHYGEKGDYRHCLYARKQLRLCLEGEVTGDTCALGVLCYGEAIKDTENPVIRRITFNPLFDTLVSEVGCFLQQREGDENGK